MNLGNSKTTKLSVINQNMGCQKISAFGYLSVLLNLTLINIIYTYNGVMGSDPDCYSEGLGFNSRHWHTYMCLKTGTQLNISAS